MDLLFHTLDNGIRLVHAHTNGIVAHCGIIINAGSRDESESEHGIAHFIEHMLFKGTKKRRSYHILSRLEDVGGELNAYTTKEDTAVHASFLRDDFERATELIADITFNSVFHEREIRKEKDVVIEEINSYLDTPAELIFDEFEEQIFAGLPIGRSILGKPETVKSFSRQKISDYISRNYNAEKIVFCSAGNIPDQKILKLFKTYFASVASGKPDQSHTNDWLYKSSSVTKKKDTFQNHCIIGNLAYSIKDDKRLGMFLLNNILGGQGLNSRLNLSLRERNGLAYSVESNYNPYSDTGSFSIYFGTDSQNLNKSISIVNSELKKLRDSRLGTIQLSKAKKQIKGYLARGYENHENLMLSLGKSLLAFNKIESFEDTCSKIDAISSSLLLEIANEVLDHARLSTLIYRQK
jgi:predicted Zn-dependent peptidase